MSCGKYGCESSNVCRWYVCSAPVLVDSNVLWIFVVGMLLNTKSPLIATKQLVFFFVSKSINNFLYQMFFWMVYVYNFWPSKIYTLFGVSSNDSLKDDDVIQRQVKLLYCAANKLRGRFFFHWDILVIFLLKYSDHLTHICIKTCRNSVH